MIRPVLAGPGQIGGALATGGGVRKWWLAAGVAPLAAYQPKGAASLAASYVNLASPGTFDAAPGVAPTWDATNGWVFDGSTQYLTTGITPASGWSLIARFSNAAPADSFRIIVGARGSLNSRLYIAAGNTPQRTYGGGGALIVAGVSTAGVMAVANQDCYWNGVAEGTTSAAWSGTSSVLWIARDPSGSFAYTSCRIQAAIIYSSTLNASQVAAVAAAMAAL